MGRSTQQNEAMRGTTILRLMIACALCLAFFAGIAWLIGTIRGPAA